MKKYLLDTNTVLLALSDPQALKPKIRAALTSGSNTISVIVYWEVLLKSMKGKLDVGDPHSWWIEALDQLAAVPLPLRADHISELLHLPPIHQDPFDRMLIAQARVEDLILMTTDQLLSRYAGEGLKII